MEWTEERFEMVKQTLQSTLMGLLKNSLNFMENLVQAEVVALHTTLSWPREIDEWFAVGGGESGSL